MRFETLAIHAGPPRDPAFGAVMPPIYQVSTFAFQGVNQPGPFDYSRSGNPTRKALEDTLAALEGGGLGYAFATGMAAEATVLGLLSAGDRVLVHEDLYGGTWRLLTSVVARHGVTVDFADLRDPAAMAAALRPETRMVWIETVTNPLITVLDLPAIAAAARRHGALTVVDNTFLSPFFARPLDLGADVVIHSTTKYLNGHSDVVGGAAIARDPDLAKRIGFLQNAMGTCCGPFDAFLVLRGIRTLSLRMERHHANAVAVARWLAQHPRVAQVLHPSLPGHPQHALATRLYTGFGGTFSFRVKADAAGIARMLGAVRTFTLAESLGGVESLIEQPWTMTHASMDAAARVRAGITEDLVRVSIGLEHPDDLTADLNRALAAI
ncbi:MAG: PLP-dependent aspartate aminotransferase family protein [Planctomycetes bacterium]|nr:PLP-dependent aspartate aminotransferase family protein [Planctomycetota bacterium]